MSEELHIYPSKEEMIKAIDVLARAGITCPKCKTNLTLNIIHILTENE